MAVFLINICKFNGCGIIFPSLGDLIQHIEDTHIDYDPKVVEQKEQAQPTCLPLSYVLRFITDAARKEPFLGATELKRKLAIKHHSYSMSSSNRSNTPTGSELDEDEMMNISESEDSNDSWTTEEFSSEFIMRYGSRHSGSGNGTGNEKPFACPVPGCKKRYKNVNGIKYHSKNGHKKDGKVRKGYKCHCGKSYKTPQGLKSHALSAHNLSTNSTSTTTETLLNNNQINGRCTSPSAGSLSPSSVSNLSGSSGLSFNIVNQSSIQHQTTSVGQSQQNNNTITTANINNNTLIRNNNSIGLISIKTNGNTNNNGTSATALVNKTINGNKVIKITSSPSSSSSSASADSTGTQTTPTKINLPNLVNLNLLTPATSPTNKMANSHQHAATNTNSVNINNTNQGNNNNITINNNNINNNSNNNDNLPLTPISPNSSLNNNSSNNNISIVKNTGSLNGSTTIINGGCFTITTTKISSCNSEQLNDDT